MTIRWRLSAFLLQIVAILFVTTWVSGTPVSGATWYSSLLALAINKQLLEPYFAKPVDVLANSLVGLVLFGLAPKTIGAPGWNALAVLLLVAALLSSVALVGGASRREGRIAAVARASRLLSGAFSARVIFSALFWLGLIDTLGGINGNLWAYALAWLIVMAVGGVNWQAIWNTARGGPVLATPEGLIGPARLLVAGPDMPARGALVTVSGGGRESSGSILARIRRANDVWAAIHIDRAEECEAFVTSSALSVADSGSTVSGFLGSVDATSTNAALVFSPTRTLRIGDVVAVRSPEGPILYQLTKAEVVDVHVKGWGHLAVQAKAIQLGVLKENPVRLVRHQWVPEPGAAVTEAPRVEVARPGESRFLLGHLIGTAIPIFLDSSRLCEGHLAILGMTRMGKTTLAARLAFFLGGVSSVIVMDQTGEYKSRLGVAPYVAADHDSNFGVSVFEPAAGKATPDEGLSLLKHFANMGHQEYKGAGAFKRVLLVDEAHQFVPEPSLLGYNAPGRDSAVTFGMYAMQVRKYGITLALISQRTAVLAKTALSQCENVIAFKSVDQTGLDYLEAVLGPQARDILPNLQQGEALVSGPAFSTDCPVAVRVATGGVP